MRAAASQRPKWPFAVRVFGDPESQNPPAPQNTLTNCEPMARKRTRPRLTKERPSAAIAMLLAHGGIAWRNQSGTYKNIHGGGYTKVGMVGGADVIGAVPLKITEDMVGETVGVLVAVEMKSDSYTKCSPEQIQFLDWVGRVGGIPVVARTMEDIEDVLVGHGIPAVILR